MTARRGPSDVIGRQDNVPRYGRGERIADATVHILGLAIALLACTVLAALALPRTAGPGLAVALGLYATGLLAMLGCSALYNMAGHGRRRALLRRLDHAAIFAMIAGTYTPVAGIGIGGAWGWALLSVVWTGAVIGAAFKLLAPARFEHVSILAYLLLGWAGIVALDQLLVALPPLDLWLLVTGGLLYSLGIVVHLSTRLRYHNALWHVLVITAAGCHYAVVLRLAQAAG